MFTPECLLARLAEGEKTPADAITLIRDLLAQEISEDEIYAALAAGMWQSLTDRKYGQEARAWQDAYRQIGALFKARSRIDLSERLRGFADLAAASARFGEVHERKSLVQRPHVISILKLIAELGGQDIRRELVREKTGLGDANLSRILGTLSSAGLISRQRNEREVVLTITRDGLAVVAASNGNAPPQPPVERAPNAPILRSLEMLPRDWRH